MIPKTIHYCWFGGNPKSKLAKKCMKSWRTFFPDYEIIEWNESNFDISAAPLYVRQAYEAKKWAFVSDYARLWIIYNYGGIYFDTDVEVIRSFEDILSDCDAFFGFEKEEFIATGLGFGAIKGSEIVYDIMKDYDDLTFIREDGTYNDLPCPRINSHVFEEYGFALNNTLQKKDGVFIYPVEYFAPKDCDTRKIVLTENTYAIHHFTATWFSKEQKKIARDYKRLLSNNKRRYKIKRLKNRAIRKIQRTFSIKPKK